MINELLVYQGNTSYKIDLYESETIDLTKSITDIVDPEQRRSDYTRTIKVPGTSNNNKVFSFIFDLSRYTINTTETQYNPDFNVALKTSAILYRNGLVQIKGFIQLTNIVKRPDGAVDYEIVLFGEVANLFKDMGEKKLRELDLSAYDHSLTVANVDTTAHTFSDGYIYPIIDTGLARFESQYFIDQMSPAVYLKTLVDKIFETYGYTYDSTFFNSNLFKNLVLWCGDNPAQYLTATQIGNRTFLADRTTNNSYAIIPTAAGTIVLPNAPKQPTTGTGYDTTTGLFVIPEDGYYRFIMTGEIYIKYNDSASNYIRNFPVTVNIWKYDGTTNYTTLATVTTFRGDPLFGGDFFDWAISIEMTTPVFLKTTDVVYLEIDTPINTYRGGLGTLEWRFNTTNVPIQFYNVPSAQKYDGANIELKNFVPQDMTQVEFMTNLKNMFNLYFEPDPNVPNKIKIEPRDDYYTDTVVDITNKVDTSKEIKITPLELAKYKTYIYQYDKDDDEYNQKYNQLSPYTYGFRKFDISNQFIKETKDIKVTFAPSPLSDTPGWHDRIFSKVRYKNKDNTYTQKVSKGRVLYANVLESGFTNVVTLDDRSGGGIVPVNGSSIPVFQYAGHLDDPNNATFDLSWGVPEIVYYSASGYTTNNLFNKYWRKNIQEITDPDSKVIELSLKLNEFEVRDLTFDKKYLIDRSYYRLIEINYNVAGYDTVQCKFFKLLPYSKWQDIGAETMNGGSEIWTDEEGKFAGDSPVFYNDQTKGDNGFNGNSNNMSYGDGNVQGSETDNAIVNSQGNAYAGEYINILGGANNQVAASNVNLLNCTGYTAGVYGEQVINNIQYPFYAASGFTQYDVTGIYTTPVCIIPKFDGYYTEITDIYGQVIYDPVDSPSAYNATKIQLKYENDSTAIAELPSALTSSAVDTRYKGTVIANLAQFEDAVFITSKEEMTGGNSAINVEVYYRLKPIK